MKKKENWHERIISEICARLSPFRNRVFIKTHKGREKGADIEIIFPTGRKINIEVQQFDSGKGWRSKIIPSWKERHDLFTFIIFPEPTIERVIKMIPKYEEYSFFKRKDVFLFPESQIPEMIAVIGSFIISESSTPSSKDRLK